MNSSTDANLRRLVENANIVGPLPLRAKAIAASGLHPLGAGIKAGKTYAPGKGKQRVPLPSSGDGFERFKDVIGNAVPGLRGDLAPLAWGALLGTPGMVFEIPVPTADALMSTGITPATRSDCTLRRLLLGAVIREDTGTVLAPGFTGPTVAGLAELTVQMTRSAPRVVDAWLAVQWVSTTRAACETLEGHVNVTQFGSKSPAPLVVMLLQADRARSFDEAQEIAARRTAAVCGFRLEVVKHAPEKHGYIIQALKAVRPSWLMVIGEDAAINAIREAFVSVSTIDRVVQFDAGTDVELREAIRERFIEIAGVAPSLSLLSVPLIVPPPPAPQRAQMPITPARCMHEPDSGHIYVLDAETELWWTHDTSGHAGVVFKRYRLDGMSLVHDADLDGSGREVENKFKGVVGRTVTVSDMFACAWPENHI